MRRRRPPHRRHRLGPQRPARPSLRPEPAQLDDLQPRGNQAAQDQLRQDQRVEVPEGQAEIVDQYRMNHEHADGFCGIATLLTTLSGLGVDHGVDIGNRNQLEAFSRGIYLRGHGSSGAKMAEKLAELGQKEARFTMGGSMTDVVKMVVSGKPVPVGVVSLAGEVVKSPQESVRYKGAVAEGKDHTKRFGESGHWVTVVGYEGPANNPTAFLVNDSDTGAQLRMTPGQLATASAANQGIWMIGY